MQVEILHSDLAESVFETGRVAIRRIDCSEPGSAGVIEHTGLVDSISSLTSGTMALQWSTAAAEAGPLTAAARRSGRRAFCRAVMFAPWWCLASTVRGAPLAARPAEAAGRSDLDRNVREQGVHSIVS